MPSPLSVNLRERVVSAVSEGASCHQAAARFGVSDSSASRWSERFRQEGQLAPKPSGGDHASHRIEAQADALNWSRAALDSASLPAKKGAPRQARTRRTGASRGRSATLSWTPTARRSV